MDVETSKDECGDNRGWMWRQVRMDVETIDEVKCVGCRLQSVGNLTCNSAAFCSALFWTESNSSCWRSICEIFTSSPALMSAASDRRD